MKFTKLLLVLFVFSVVLYLILVTQFTISKRKIQTALSNPVKKEENIASLLPGNVFVRDIQKLPDKDNSFLALYVEPGYKNNSWDLSCPGEILGDSIIGNYHLVLVKDGKLINDLKIPPVFIYPENTLELTYKNYKDGWPMENEAKAKEVIKLLDLKDMTGDNTPYEFLLTTTGGGCGFYDGLVAGYDPERNKAVLFSDWLPRFSPDDKGNYYYLFECGDHGNETRREEKYSFDNSTKSYKKIWEKETPCEPQI